MHVVLTDYKPNEIDPRDFRVCIQSRDGEEILLILMRDATVEIDNFRFQNPEHTRAVNELDTKHGVCNVTREMVDDLGIPWTLPTPVRIKEEEIQDIETSGETAWLRCESGMILGRYVRRLPRDDELRMLSCEPASTAPTQGDKATTDADPKRKRSEPYSKKSQETFATLYQAARMSLGRSPFIRDFLDDHKTAMAKIRVTTIADGKRIRDAARKNGLLPKWNARRKKGTQVKQRKNSGKGCQ